jgi:pimeloyl-ACP methyl ester carboxylesterase
MPTAFANGIELDYDTFGSPDDPALLLIMGFSVQKIAWDEAFCQLLADRGLFIIRFDNRDVGLSTKITDAPEPNLAAAFAGDFSSAGYQLEDMADDAAGLLDALGIPEAHIVGASMGGMIAQELALRHPERVHGLVLACTFPEPDADIERNRRFSVQQLGGSITDGGDVQIDLKAINPMDFLQQLLPLVFNQEFIANELPKLLQVFSGALQYGFSMEAILGQVGAVMNHKATDRLGKITAPTLVITGDADRLIPPANSDILAKGIPGAKLVKIPGGSHGFNFETPEVFNRAVLEFLAGVHN